MCIALLPCVHTVTYCRYRYVALKWESLYSLQVPVKHNKPLPMIMFPLESVRMMHNRKYHQSLVQLALSFQEVSGVINCYSTCADVK